MKTKTSLRKKKKAYLLDMLREAYPWKPRYFYDRTKEEIIELLLEDQNAK